MSESYTLPEPGSITTPEQASAEIDRVFAEVVQDKNHPYSDAHHGLHRKYSEHVAAMFELKADGDTRTPMQRTIDSVCDEAMAAKVEKQNKLVKEAEAEMAKLVALGFDDDEIPDDLQEYQLDGLRMQRLTAERKFEELVPILEKQLRSLKTPPSLIAAFQSFAQAQEMDDILKANIADQIVAWVYQANEQKYGRKKSKD
jgi:lysophospholipase L1-like esterase